MRVLFLSVLVVSLTGIMIVPNVFGQDVIPSWVKNNAGWWATNQINDSTFLQGIQYLIKEGIMVISPTETAEKTGSQEVPSWIKNSAGWWADGQIDNSSFVLGMQWLISNGIIIVEEKLIHTDVDFRVAFIGDQGLGLNSIAVLNLIKDEGAQMVLHQGDFDYKDDPDKWDKQISDVLGSDFPYFASIGNHDLDSGLISLKGYQEKLYDRLEKNPDVVCDGDLGVKSSCTYRGLFFILAAPGLIGSNYDSFIEKQLNNNDNLWRVCSWHYDMITSQTEAEQNETGLEIYESCKNGGAIIVTGHKHFYARSLTLIDFENRTVDPEWSEPNKLRVKEGSTFTVISGIGGSSIHKQDPCLPFSYHGCNDEWSKIYTATQDANFGALFCTFNAGGQPNKTYCYFKNIDGRIIDEFTLTSFLANYPQNTNLIDVDMSGRNLTGDDFSNMVIMDSNLSDAILIGADLTNAVLIGTTLTGADLTDANLTGVSLAYKDLTGTILIGADLTDASLTDVDLSGQDLTGTILRGADLTDTNLTDFDFSGMDLTGTILRGIDLSGQDLTGTILRGADLTDANLSGQDLSDHDLTDVILRGANLSNSVLPTNGLSGKTFESTIFNGADLSGNNLSESDFESTNFKNTNLKNTNLNSAQFLVADLTGANLAGADLTRTSFVHSNLSGVNLSGAIMDRNNFSNTNLSGQDFTVISNASIWRSVYAAADLSNANFEGISLYDDRIYEFVSTNNANLSGKSNLELNELLGKFPNHWTIGKRIVGNDLIIQYIYFSNFVSTDLQNANFSNADLRRAAFHSADLTNANLSGADLRKAVLDNADLSNANLEGALLDGANLNCLNHPICKSE